MTAWTYIWVGGALSLVGTVLLTLGWKQFQRQEEAFSLSIPPSVEITLSSPPSLNQKEVIIENTGQHELINVELTPVFYRVDATELKITSRQVPSNGIKLLDNMKPRQTYSISVEASTFFVDAKALDKQNELTFVALAVTFRRKADNKRFVEIEPFLISGLENQKILYPLYANKSSGMGGNPETFIKAMREIIEIEKFMFRA